MQVNIHEAKTHLSRLVERAAHGEEIIIGKAGRPMARLVPYRDLAGPRTPGAWRGQIQVADDFDETPDGPSPSSTPSAPGRFRPTIVTRSIACWWPKPSSST
jgi:prevent-host-death family protein